MAVSLISSEDIDINQTGNTIDLRLTSTGVAKKNVYSTTETRIGTWIDGKPIYRKTFTGTTGNTSTEIDMSSLNIKRIIKETGNVGEDNNTKGFPFILESAGTVYFVSTRYSYGTMYISNSSAYGNLPFYLTVEYTKTTD